MGFLLEAYWMPIGSHLDPCRIFESFLLAIYRVSRADLRDAKLARFTARPSHTRPDHGLDFGAHVHYGLEHLCH